MHHHTRLLTLAALTLSALQPFSPSALSSSAPFDLASCERARTLRLADAALAATPKTITAVRNPRGAGGPHDFSSEGDYWWPDPETPSAPYIQRDGETNPANFVAHRQLLMEFSRNVSALAAAFKLTGDQRYADAALAHLRAWFIDPATRMNPSLLYSQAIQGRFTGRGIGIIDTLHLCEVAMSILALRETGSGLAFCCQPASATGAAAPHSAIRIPHSAIDAATDAALTAWFRDYLHWMRTHPYGIDESNAANNHGTCWTLQAACYALVTQDAETLALCRDRLTKIHIPNQMAPDGSFPQELRRTKPYGYSIFNLDVMAALAQVLSTKDTNYLTWRVSPTDDRSLIKAIAYLYPYLADKTQWPHKHDVMYWDNWPVRQPALLFGALATNNADWLALWKTLDPDPTVEEVQRNYPIRHPILWFRDPQPVGASLATPCSIQ